MPLTSTHSLMLPLRHSLDDGSPMPSSVWLHHLRIVTDESWGRVQARLAPAGKGFLPDHRVGMNNPPSSF
jgi:hypothetical protein